MAPVWATTAHLSRRSHEQAPSDLHQPPASTANELREPRRRTSSDSTPRQTSASTRFLTSANEQDANKNILSSIASVGSESFVSARRLGFFADKISSPHPKTSALPSQLGSVKPDSTATLAPTFTPTSSLMNSSPGPASLPKSHTSPSKASYGRTYDAKLVSREMHRLAPLLSSTSSMTLVPPGNISQVNLAATSNSDPWGALHVHVLPLFNGEPLRIPIEDLNSLVKRHIQTVVTSTPHRALNMLETDAAELIASGMVTLNAKLMGIHESKLIARVVETWNFFWDQVLTYVEGVLLPLQTHPLLSSLYRTPKSHRTKSPSRPSNAKSSTMSELTSTHIDVRTIALRSFRDRVIFPLSSRLLEQLYLETLSETYHQPRLQQMLLVLASQSENRSNTFSLAPDPDASPSAAAVDDLLRALRSTRQERSGLFNNSPTFPVRAPSFLSGGLPRDRRGRVAHKHRSKPSALSLRLEDNDNVFTVGDETPRLAQSFEADNERRLQLLDLLKSPDVETMTDPKGGWGLGAGQVDKTSDDDDDDELDHLQLQEKLNADLDRMVGIPASNPPESGRRRMT